jgi:hypothetical protein
MAIRNTVLYETGGNLRIMSAAQLDEIRHLAAYFYQQNQVETLSYVASGGNLSPTMTDRRYQAGAAVFNGATSFASEAATPDISAIDTTYDRISKTRVSSVTQVEPNENATNTAFPIYWDTATNSIKAMTKDDFFDTFIGYTITNGLVGNGSVSKIAAGTYTILTNSSAVAGNPGTTLVNASPIFVDTRADASAYTAAGIEETQDQPTTINSYYLHQIQQTSKPTYQMPLFVRTDGTGVQVYTTATFEDLVENYIVSAAFGKAGYSITHEMGTSVSNQKGTSINDTYLSGSSASGYTQYLATIDDYRTQEFPNGAVAILNSYKLGVTTGASYSASADVSTADEGDTVTFTLSAVNVTPGTVAYTITGIDSSDISAGALSGNITLSGSFASSSGTTQITLANDSNTEGTETATFNAGGASVSVTINDTSLSAANETVSLEGTALSPETNGVPPLTDGSILMGWRVNSSGTIEDYDSDRFPQYSATGHLDWNSNAPSPTKTYYVRATVYSSDTGQSFSNPTPSPNAYNTWLQLNTSRSFFFSDNSASNSYGPREAIIKLDISESATGSDQVTSNQYSLSSPEYYWLEEQIDFSEWRVRVYWNGTLKFNQTYNQEIDIPTSVQGSDNYTYDAGTTQGGGYFAVTQTIPGILATGYYKNIYEGGS